MKVRRSRVFLAVLLATGIGVAIAELSAQWITAEGLRPPEFRGSTGRSFPNPERVSGPGMEWARGTVLQGLPPWDGTRKYVREGDVIQLTAESEVKAVAALEQSESLELTADQFKEYSGRAAVHTEPVRAFLVRNVEYEDGPPHKYFLTLEGDRLVIVIPLRVGVSLRKRPMIVYHTGDIRKVWFGFLYGA